MKTFKLEKQPKIESGFRTPENYFDTFSERVLQQLLTKELATISIFSKRKTWFYAVAAILILGLLIPIYYLFNSPSSDLDDATVENYIAYQYSVSDADLANLLNEEDIQKISVDLNIEDKIIENELTENKNLEYYLLN